MFDGGYFISPEGYANAFTPNQPNLLVGDAGVSQIVDPLKFHVEQPDPVKVIRENIAEEIIVYVGVTFFLLFLL